MGLKAFWQWFTTNKAKKEKNVEQKLVVQQKAAQPVQKQIQKEEISQETITQHTTKKKKLGSGVILFILINSILGSSLFYLPSLGVISSGAASIIGWIAIFILAIFIMLYIGELITLHPTSGGTYAFCRKAYGRFVSFIAGWLIWIGGNFGMALGVVAAAEYFIPTSYANYFILRIVFAAIWILVLNFMAFRGIDAGATMLVVFGIIASVVVVAMTLPSFLDIPALFSGTLQSPFNVEFLRPFFQHEGISILSYLGLTMLLISEAFFGFEAVTYMANEVEDPKKLPKILITSIVICGGIMSLYVFSSLGTVAYHDYVQNARPFAVQALNTMGTLGETVVVFGMYLVIIGAVAAWPIVGSRLLQAMAKDRLFLQHFEVLHPKHKSPHRAVYFQTIAVSLFSWFVFRGYIVQWGNPYRTIYLIYVLLSLAVLSLILLAVPILRRKEKDVERPFKAPFGRSVPYLFVVLFIVLIWNWVHIEGGTAISILMLTGSFILFGVPFYFLVEMFYNQKSIVQVNEWLSYVALFSEKIFFPLTIRKKVLNDIGDAHGKTILEYGCSVGTLTKKLAPKVGDRGRIFATDLSLKKVQIADKRTRHIKHVSVHHHPHLDDFKLELTQKVDGVISIGMLSYMQQPQRILKNLSKHVVRGGEIVFVDYDKFFWFIPNVKWIENDSMLVSLFKNAGFDVTVERKNGLLWQYILIKGTKI
ncbi:amino acid permease [Candidatus Woesearchaeota archaeon]|nr:amino acid permease [Candidatus Woesearchaeota archaeon]MBT5397082.1 amino acid permease [Candidatus Woesearchaeota archaeon]MBT6367372.1 amino acid permease [Candidatus Woesearchaeota archaeon]MBT7762482.1 amino acid permease [Candidatus Woesearchaeota archaeon]